MLWRGSRRRLRLQQCLGTVRDYIGAQMMMLMEVGMCVVVTVVMGWRLRGGWMMLLPAMVNAFMIVQAVKRAKHFVTQITDGIVQRLQVLLLLVPLERELCA